MLDISPVTPNDNDDELRGGGKPSSGGGGGGGGGGNNTRQPAQGTTKWREGTSTPGPSRQGTGLSGGAAGPSDGVYFNAEAGPSRSGTVTPPRTTRQGSAVRQKSHPDVHNEQTQLQEHLANHSNSLPPSPTKSTFYQTYPPTSYANPAPIHAKFSQSAGEVRPSSPIRGVTMPRSESPMGYKQSSSSEHGHARNSSSSSGSLPPHPLSGSTSFPSPDPHSLPTHPFFHHPHLPPIPPSSLASGSSEIDDVMVIPSSDEEISHVGAGGWKLVSRRYRMGSGAGNSTSGGAYAQGGGGGGFMALGSGKKEKERERAEKERIRMMRRRTTIDRSGTLFVHFHFFPPSSCHASSFHSVDPRSILIHTRLTDLIPNDMSPIQETDSVADSNVGVTRSRTLPSRSTKGSSSAVDEKENSTMDIVNTQPTVATRTQGSKEKLKGSVREKGVLRKQRRASTPTGRSAMVA